MRKLTIKRETVDLLERGELEQVVGASISCPIVALRDKVYAITAGLVNEPDTGIPTYCHCP